MDFNLSDLQRMLLDSAERYLADRFTLEHRRRLRDNADGLDGDAWANFAELGWLAIAIPEEHGGLGGSMADVAVLATALGGHCVAAPLASSAVIAPTLLCGAEAVPDELLAEIVAGTARISLAHDEPGERYAYRAPRQTRVDDDGRVTGQKMFALDAPSATHLIATAMDGDDLALVLVPADAAGIHAEPYPLFNGARAADLRFDGVVGVVLAQGASAQALLDLALDRARIVNAAEMLGSMEADLTLCSAYVKERQQFGQPIGKFQSLQHIMADMFVATHQARSILYAALAAAEADTATRARAISLARINISEAYQLVARQAIQLHGGYGITDEYEVSHHYRHQLVLEKLYGDLDFHERRLSAR